MFCTKFKLSADCIQLLKVLTGLGFTLCYWHKLFVEVYDKMYSIKRNYSCNTTYTLPRAVVHITFFIKGSYSCTTTYTLPLVMVHGTFLFYNQRWVCFSLFDLILYVPVNKFSVMLGWV